MQKDTLRAPIRIVQSRQNSRIKELRTALHHNGKTGDGRIAIEGFHLLDEAIRSKLAITTVFFAEEQELLLKSQSLPTDTELLAVPPALLRSVLATETPQPIAAMVEAPRFRWDDLLKPNALIVVAAGLQDPGNLGTVIRSAEAFGATGMITLPGTVNQWNPKALRASSGSAFRLPILATSENEAITRLQNAGIRIIATTVDGGNNLEKYDWTQPTALLLGNEGGGLTPSQVAAADLQMTIPCPGPVESLNAAVAASILLYVASSSRISGRTTGGKKHV